MNQVLNSIRITTPEQVEVMRTIYNDNLDTLATRPIPNRSYEDQQKWWSENSSYIEAYLYEDVNYPNVYIAFLLLSNRGHFKTPMMAIRKEFWGKGYGESIIIDYIEKAKSPIAGSQLQSNGAICHLNKKLGWQIIETVEHHGEKVDLLYHPGVSVKEDPEIRNEISVYLKNIFNK